MEGFLRAPCQYAQDQRVTSYPETWEYRRAAYDLEAGWTAFRSTLTAEQEQRLKALLDRERSAGELEGEAIFPCGLSIRVGLGQL